MLVSVIYKVKDNFLYLDINNFVNDNDTFSDVEKLNSLIEILSNKIIKYSNLVVVFDNIEKTNMLILEFINKIFHSGRFAFLSDTFSQNGTHLCDLRTIGIAGSFFLEQIFFRMFHFFVH